MTDSERRAADEAQLLALAAAEAAGTLPAKDRRHDESEPVVPIVPETRAEGIARLEASDIHPDAEISAFVPEFPKDVRSARVDAIVDPAVIVASDAAANVQPQVFDVLDALDKSHVGSVFEKTAIGWNVKWVDGGTVIHVQGPTIIEALASHGVQVVHPFVPEGPILHPKIDA